MHDCINYFKNNNFEKLFCLFKERYESLGKIGGNVSLKTLNSFELEVLSSFLGKQINGKKMIGLLEFEHSLLSTKFKEYSLYEILMNYFDNKLIIKKEVRLNKLNMRNIFFEEKVELYCSTAFGNWLEFCLNNDNSKLNKYYNSDKEKLEILLDNVAKCTNNLPKEDESVELAIFAANNTGDPHYLDIDTKEFNLFINVLEFIFEDNTNSRNSKIELLNKANIIMDATSNFVTIYNLKAMINSEKHQGIEHFNSLNEPVNLSLTNIEKITSFDTDNKKVFIFENPSLLNRLIHIFPDVSFIVTRGIPNFAFYSVLKKLDYSNTIFYNGDFDPEGILIADKLKQKYPRLVLFNYSANLYMKSISNKRLTFSRLKKISVLNSKELIDICKIMCDCKYCGYQEKIIEEIIDYISKVN